MSRRNRAFTALVDPLEDRLALSHLGVHHADVIGHHHAAAITGHHAASIDHHHSTQAGPHHEARSRHHHAARHRHHHHAVPVPPVTGPGPTGTPPGPTSGDSGSAASTVALSGAVKGGNLLDGSGTLGPLGSVISTGTLTTSGAEPVNYSGTITLVGATGSITASLSGQLFGPDRPGETIHLTYTITGGTGAFQGATGSGQAYFAGMASSTGEGFTLSFGVATTTPA
jgi:hypothetical protein